MAPPVQPTASNQPDPLAAEIIDSACQGLAAMIVRRLVGDGGPSARTEPLRHHPFVDWKGSTAARLQYLAAALSVGSPALFLEQIAWTKVAFATRGLSTDELRLNLSVMRQVLEEELPANTRASALALLDAGLTELERAPDDSPPQIAGGSPHARLAAAYLLEVLEGDRRAAVDVILRAASEGVPVTSLLTQVLAPAQAEVGRMWHRGEVSVAEEHFTTTTTHLAISLLYPMLPRTPSNGKTVVCAAVEGNIHDVGIRIVADFFEMAGWRSIYLGADMPADDLGHAILDYSADALAISAGISTQLRPLRAAIERVRLLPRAAGVAIVVGGGAFGADPLLWRTIGADVFAATAEDAPRALGEFLKSRT